MSTVSHELRTPLTSILGFTEALLSGGPGPLTEVQEEFLEICQENGNRLLRLVNDLLDVSHLDSGHLTLEIERVELTRLLSGLVQTIRPVAQEKDVRIALEAPADKPVFVEADQRRLEQVITNLLSNAVKFTPEGGRVLCALHMTPPGYVLDGKQVSQRGVHIQVQDTGMGIRAEDVSRLFQPFQRARHKGAKQIQGTGLGLHITKRLVDMHHGHVWVDTAVDVGSTFHVWLPVRQPRPSELGQSELSSTILSRYFTEEG